MLPDQPLIDLSVKIFNTRRDKQTNHPPTDGHLSVFDERNLLLRESCKLRCMVWKALVILYLSSVTRNKRSIPRNDILYPWKWMEHGYGNIHIRLFAWN